MQNAEKSFLLRSPPQHPLCWLVWNPTRNSVKPFSVTSAIQVSKLWMAWTSTKVNHTRKHFRLKSWENLSPNPLSLCPPWGTRVGWNPVTTVTWTCPLLTFAKMKMIPKLMKLLKLMKLKHPLFVVVAVGPLNAVPATLKWWSQGSRCWGWFSTKRNNSTSSISSDLKANYGRGSRADTFFYNK